MLKSKHSIVLLSAMALLTSIAQADSTNYYTDRHFRSPNTFGSAQPAAEADLEAAPAKAAPVAVAPSRVDDSLFPPSGKPGECYARVLVPAKTETVTERVVAREESFELIEIPAVLETVDERVMVRAATETQEIIPATYKTVEERILKSPAYTRQIPVAARYETKTERVLVKPERSYWKKGSGPLSKTDGETGEIMCYVTDPAVYDTVSRTVLVSPATVREEQVPAIYETVKRTVVDQPAQVKKTPVAAVYDTVKVQKVKSPARTEKRVIPAEYSMVTRQVTKGTSHMEWRRVLCETNVTPDVIADLQTRLNARGFSAGAVDGNYGASTARAVDAFQAANGLSQGSLTYETLAALGISK